MAILFDEKKKVFTLQTKNTTWQMQVGRYGHLLHLYYGRRVGEGVLDYLVRGINRGFSGAPYEAGEDRGYSLDTYPQEYSAYGVGDYRISCLSVEHGDGSRAAELLDKADIGQVAEGFRADLLIVRGNPLKKMSDIRNMRFVLKDGEIVSCREKI